MAFATDLGRITPTVKRFISKAKHLVIESNYDADMLRNGKYNYFLKRRILGENGHLCNAVTAKFLADNFCECCFKKIFLCHISNENNTPELALKTTTDALSSAGIKVGEEVDVCVQASSTLEAEAIGITMLEGGELQCDGVICMQCSAVLA